MRIGVWAFIIFCGQLTWAAMPSGTSTTSLEEVRKESQTKPFRNAVQVGFLERRLNGRTENVSSDKNLEISPNVGSSYSLGWSNRPLGISVNANVAHAKNEERDQRKIQTSAEDYQLRYFTQNIGIELIYQRYRGFNLNDEKSESHLVSTEESTLPDMKMSNAQIQFDWSFKGVSALETFGSNWGKPTKDGAGYYLAASYSHFTFSNPTPFLPQSANVFGADTTLMAGNYQTLAGGIGASYIWQWTRFYIAGLISAHAGPQLQDYETSSGHDQGTKWVWFPQAKFVMGWDWTDYYLTFIFHSHRVSVNMQDTDFAFFSQENSVNFGVRF